MDEWRTFSNELEGLPKLHSAHKTSTTGTAGVQSACARQLSADSFFSHFTVRSAPIPL